MDLGFVIPVLVVFALILATVAGFVAARVLLHAAETAPAKHGETNDR